MKILLYILIRPSVTCKIAKLAPFKHEGNATQLAQLPKALACELRFALLGRADDLIVTGSLGHKLHAVDAGQYCTR